MLALKRENATPKTGKSIMYILSCFSVFAYIVSAISCEMTPETAIISTLAIYCVFAVGLFFLIQKNSIIINEYVVFMLLFCVYVYIRCIAQNASITMGMQIAYWVLTCIVACLFVFWMSSKYSDLITFAMAAYVLGALILSARIVVEYGGINEMIIYASGDGENRVGGLLGNENGIGLFLANGILCSLVFFIKNKLATVKVLTVISMFLLGAMLLLTGSRKSIAFVLIGAVLIVYFNYRKANISKKLIVYLLLAVVLVGVYNAITTLPMFSTINERINLLFEGFFGENATYETDQTRKMMITKGLEAFYEKPLFGHGTGYSYKLFGTYSHNNFVELLMNYGVLGLLLFYLPYIGLIINLVKRIFSKDIIAIYFFVYTSMQIILGIGWVNYYSRTVQIVTALAFGYLIHSEKQNNERLDENESK